MTRELIPSAYALYPPRDEAERMLPIEIVRTGRKVGNVFELNEDVWAIRQRGMALNRDGEWEWEPQPSSRTDEWLEQHRFTLEEAKAMAAKL